VGGLDVHLAEHIADGGDQVPQSARSRVNRDDPAEVVR
jgi:hypothetical protein